MCLFGHEHPEGLQQEVYGLKQHVEHKTRVYGCFKPAKTPF